MDLARPLAFDNRLGAQRLMAARTARARQGIAVSPPPTGYVRSVRGAWIKDPDRSVQDAIQRVFDLDQQLRSLGKVATYFREHSLEFPRGCQGGDRLAGQGYGDRVTSPMVSTFPPRGSAL